MKEISEIKKRMNRNLFLFSTLGFSFMTIIVIIHKNYLNHVIPKSELFFFTSLFLISSIIIINIAINKIKNSISETISTNKEENSHQIALKIINSSNAKALKLGKKYIIISNWQSFFFGVYLSWLPSLLIYFAK